MGMFGAGSGFSGNPNALSQGLSKMAGFFLANGGSPAGQQMMQDQSLGDRNTAELQRQMAMAQWKQANPGPTNMQQNYDYLKGIRPDLAETYLRSQANPMTMTADPATGNLRWGPKAGPDPVPSLPSPKSQTDYDALPSGSQYLGSDGQTRIKG